MTSLAYRIHRDVPSAATWMPPSDDADVLNRLSERIIQAISNPSGESEAVARAVDQLLDALSTSGQVRRSLVVTSTASRFDAVVRLLSDAIAELAEDPLQSVEYLGTEALPQFVPPGWSDFLRSRGAVHDAGFTLPWNDSSDA